MTSVFVLGVSSAGERGDDGGIRDKTSSHLSLRSLCFPCCQQMAAFSHFDQRNVGGGGGII